MDKKSLQHLRNDYIFYIKTNINDIPVNESITELDFVPTPDEIYNNIDSFNDKKYIKVNNIYYKLKGAIPSPEDLKDGELAISYQRNYETLIFKNSKGGLVEITPTVEDKNLLRKIEIKNPQLTIEDNKENDENIKIWKIPYTYLKENYVYQMGAVVFLRNLTNGKQTIPDVTFNDNDENVEIEIYTNDDNINKDTYLCVIIGSKFI